MSGYIVVKLLDDDGAETESLVLTAWANPSDDGAWATLRRVIEPGDSDYAMYLSELEAGNG